MTDWSSTDDPQPFSEPTPVMIVDGIVLSESGVGPLEGISLYGPGMLADGEGVYAHTFKCLDCRLEFVLFSWLPTGTEWGALPGMRVRAPMLHYRFTLSSYAMMIFDDSRARESKEIYQSASGCVRRRGP